MMSRTSEAEVFIIETLDRDDERHFCEGKVIARTLRMAGKRPIYNYIRTRDELQHFVDKFEDSNYRYLHISCHGCENGISTTLDYIPAEEFSKIVGPALHNRRLFLSTCKASNIRMAKAIAAHGRYYSLAGPKRKMNFDDSVIMWCAFYHLMFKERSEKMSGARIKRVLSKCAGLVGEQMNFFDMASGEIESHLLPDAQKERIRISK